MGIIEKYKKFKDDKKLINIVINSNRDYRDHSINVLKTCLNSWTKKIDANLPVYHSPFKYDWIYVNEDNDEKLYFIQATKEELVRHKLNNLIDNEDVMAESYMNAYIEKYIYGQFTNPSVA